MDTYLEGTSSQQAVKKRAAQLVWRRYTTEGAQVKL